MNDTSHFPFLQTGKKLLTSRRGVALITVLSILAVVSVLIVGFTMTARLDRIASGSYSKGVKAEQLAYAGLEEVILDLRKEMKVGSYDDTTTVKGLKYYEPVRDTNDIALSILPRRIGYPPTVKNAIRRSVGFTTVNDYYHSSNFPALGARSSSYTNSINNTNYYATNATTKLPDPVLYQASTTNASKNYRSISIERWLKPRLVNTNDSDEYSAFMSNAPDWVYVTRNGILKQANNLASMADKRDPTNYVIGRYAYVVYDVGGLIDISVAGHVTTNASLDPLNYGTDVQDPKNISWTKKGLIQAADLTLLSIDGVTGTIPSSEINNLLGWRDANAVNSLNNYVEHLFGENNDSYIGTNAGFIGTNNLIGSGFTKTSKGNNAFISRQDLINYCKNGDLENYLPLFTTFSREKNAPSWSPRYAASYANSYTSFDTNISSYSGYSSNASWTYPGYPNSVNTNIAGARFTNAAGTNFRISTVTVDGKVTNIMVPNGTPVLRKRFPLSRLAWLKLSGDPYAPNSSLEDAIHQAFGLKWTTGASPIQANDTNSEGYGMPRWVYTSPDGNVATNHIKTLTEVAALNSKREPDFFEILKASILDGSLGVLEAYETTKQTTNATTCDMYDQQRNPDFQILRIGANIIDQADDDSFATAIDMRNPVAANTANAQTIYGVESLPYLSHIVPWNGSVATNNTWWSTWITPVVWDVSQNTANANNFTNSNGPSATAPMYFRVAGSGGRMRSWVKWAKFKGLNTNLDNYHSNVALPYPAVPGLQPDENCVPTPEFTNSSNYPASRTVTWNPKRDIIYYTRSTTNQLYYWPRYTNGNVRSNLCVFNEPTQLIRAYADAKVLLEDGATENANNSNTVVNYKTNFSRNGTNNVWGVKADTNSLGVATASWGTATFDARPAVLGFNTGIYKPSSSSLSSDSNANIGRHFVLDLLGNGTNAYLDGKVTDTFAITELKPTLILQASTSMQGPWRTYQVVEKLDSGQGAGGRYWGGSSGSGTYSSGGYYSGYNYTNQNVNGTNITILYNPPELGTEPWQINTSLIMDPRTTRFNFSSGQQNVGLYSIQNAGSQLFAWTPSPNANDINYVAFNAGYYNVGKGFFTIDDAGVKGDINNWFVSVKSAFNVFFAINTESTPLRMTPHGANAMYSVVGYYDRDGVCRAGDYYLGQYYSGTTEGMGISPMAVRGAKQLQSRPLVLNRPFRNVGELGYVHRDMPWKSLDFFTTNSADAGLLDAFTSYDYNSDVTAGKVNLNTPYPSILAAIFSGGQQSEKEWVNTTNGNNGNNVELTNNGSMIPYQSHPTASTATNSTNNAYNMASNIVFMAQHTSINPKPYKNISQFITRSINAYDAAYTNTIYSNYPSSSNTNTALPLIKSQRETWIRSLSESTQTRTWNLMIDIVAQTGRFSSDITVPSLDNFTVEGERRYWLHLAIDRYTGEVIDQKLEPVYE